MSPQDQSQPPRNPQATRPQGTRLWHIYVVEEPFGKGSTPKYFLATSHMKNNHEVEMLTINTRGIHARTNYAFEGQQAPMEAAFHPEEVEVLPGQRRAFDRKSHIDGTRIRYYNARKIKECIGQIRPESRQQILNDLLHGQPPYSEARGALRRLAEQLQERKAAPAKPVMNIRVRKPGPHAKTPKRKQTRAEWEADRRQNTPGGRG